MEEALSKVVKDFRVRNLGKSQADFAKEANLTKPTLIAVEHGARPSLKTYEKLAKILGVDSRNLRELKTKKGEKA